MADGRIRRFVTVIFDTLSGKKAEKELVASLGEAGKKGGDMFARNLKASFAKEMAELKVLLAKGVIDEKEFKKRSDAAFRAFNKGMIEGIQKARKEGKLTDAEFVKLANTLKRTGDQGMSAGARIQGAFIKLGATLAATFTAQKVLSFFRGSIEASLEAERSVQRLDSALRPLGLTYAQVGKRAEVYLDRLQETTRFSDEDAREALTALVVGTGDYQRSLELLEVTAKIAEFRQISMAEAAKVAIKANQGVTRGLQDMGIGLGETGDLVAKLNQNLGDIAVEGGRTSEGTLKRINNLWGEFKERIGDAILGTDTLKESGSSLVEILKNLNKWAVENKENISDLTTVVVGLANAFVRAGALIGKYFQGPGKLTIRPGGPLGAHFGFEGGLFGSKPDAGLPTADPIVVTGPAGARTRGTPTGKGGKKSDADREAEREQRRTLQQREALAREIAIKEIQLNEQVTESYAAEQIRRQEILGQSVPVTFGPMEEGFKRLNELNLLLAAGFDQDLIPKLGDTRDKIQEIVPAVDNLATAFGRLSEDTAAAAASQAEAFKEPWIDAMGIIRNEVEGQGTLFLELGQAWAEGGFAGLAALAKAKIKENLARVIEATAKALGSLALGNPASAALHAKEAAAHGAAALAWKGVSAISGGGGGSGGGAGAGGAGGAGTGSAAARSAVPETEVHIYLDGPGFDALNPKVQKVVHGALRNARERFGENVKLHVRKGG